MDDTTGHGDAPAPTPRGMAETGDGTVPEGAVQEIDLADRPGGRWSWWPLVGVVGLLAVAVAIAVVAVGGDDDGLGTTADPDRDAPGATWDRTWTIDRIVDGGDDRPVVPAGTEPPTLTLTESDGVSFTGCNGGAGAARLDGDRLVVDDVMSTLMGCEGPDGQALMAQDVWLGEFLMAGPTFAVAGDTLVLATDDAEVHLREAAPADRAPAEIDGGFWGSRWQVLEVDPLDPALPADLAGDVVADRFALDATVAGQVSFDGCNGGGGDASLDGDVLEVSPMSSTEMACGGPDGEALMAWDRWMADFLTSGPTVAVDGDDLTLTGTDATVRLRRLGDPVAATPGSSFGDAGDPDAPVSNEPQTTMPRSDEPSAPPGADGASSGGSRPSPGVAPGTDAGS